MAQRTILVEDDLSGAKATGSRGSSSANRST